MNNLVLSLFPGFGLLDRAFEEEGFCVVRGPDILWGGSIQRFHPPPGVFGGVIGGPPCQPHSTAKEILNTSDAVDLIPEFVRVAGEAGAEWGVMENVRGAIGHEAIPPQWDHCLLTDCDCGGLTKRTRVFYMWPFFVMQPGGKWGGGDSSLSVLASTAKKGCGQHAADKRFLPGNLPVEEYERLQGVPGHTKAMMDAGSSKYFAVHGLGNGVPLSMGRYIARSVRSHLSQPSLAPV